MTGDPNQKAIVSSQLDVASNAMASIDSGVVAPTPMELFEMVGQLFNKTAGLIAEGVKNVSDKVSMVANKVADVAPIRSSLKPNATPDMQLTPEVTPSLEISQARGVEAVTQNDIAPPVGGGVQRVHTMGK